MLIEMGTIKGISVVRVQEDVSGAFIVNVYCVRVLFDIVRISGAIYER